jgi:hypothetical protein
LIISKLIYTNENYAVMNKERLPLMAFTFLFASIQSLAQPVVQWDRIVSAPTNTYTFIWAAKQTPDGGYILGGQADGGVGGEKTGANKGETDYWVIKLRADRTIEWDQTYGGEFNDILKEIVLTPDGGYLLGGYSSSNAGVDKSEDCTCKDGEGDFSPDYWLVKISSNGTKQWDKTYGGVGEDFFKTLQITSNGGFLLAGGAQGGYNVFNLSASGDVLWEKTYRSLGFSQFGTIEQTSDGGYIMVGSTDAGIGNDKTTPSNSAYDYWIIKTDPGGSVLWDKTFGGSGRDIGDSIHQLSDGSFVVCGRSNSPISGDKGEDRTDEFAYDPWILGLDATGALMWEEVFGSSGRMSFYEEKQDGQIVLAGISLPNLDKTSNTNSAWMLTVDSTGSKVSDLSLPYTLSAFSKTSDGGFLLYGGVYRVVKFSNPEPPLPVTLKNFSATKENTIAELTWQTTSETNSDRFEVEHSVNAKSWNPISIVYAKGQSNALQSYQFTHASPVNGDNYYRLKMIDTDGTFTHSRIEQVKFDLGFDVLIYPNPVTETIHLQAADWSKVKRVRILNNQGKALYSSVNKPSQDINARSLKPGLYFIKVMNTDGTETTRKIAIGQ